MLIDESEPITRAPRKDKIGRGRQYRKDQAKQARRDEAKQHKPFVAWDGEGYNRDGRHYYSLFGNSLGATVSKPSLTWKDCISLLLASPKDAYHVIYAGTYDIVMMFRDTPVVARLLEGRVVRYGNYRMLYRRGKYFQVTDMTRKGSTRTLYDVFTFFRSSFVNACREYGVGTSTMLDQVEEMKGLRNEFTEITSEVRRYMGQELDLLVQLCDNLRNRLALANIYPARWHGPGAIASTVLRTHKISQAKGTYSDAFRIAAESAYYGGRFEQFQRGTYLGPVYQYDIRSAYPAGMTLLPDLSQVTWEYHDRSPKAHNDYALYYVHSRRVNDNGIGNLSHRNRYGTIYYPNWSQGWYWGVECRNVSLKQRLQYYDPSGPGLTARPFQFVAQAYRERAALKRANQPQQLAIKLMLNSLYGKLAQSKGARYDPDTGEWQYPTYHETVWAGWITAYTRSKLAEAMHLIPSQNVIACETDSVFSTSPIDLPLSDNLGDWELTMSDGIRYIQSGVSMVLQDGGWKFKTRGFTVKRTGNEVAVWTEFLESRNPTMLIRQTRFGTDPRQDTFGTWYTMDRQLTLEGNGLEKRIHTVCAQCSAGKTYGEALHHMAVAPVPFGESVPYKFAWRDKGATEVDMDFIFQFEDDPILYTEYLQGGKEK